MAVTGSPRVSTRRMRSSRSHFDVFLDSVEMMISSKFPSRTACLTDSNGSEPPTIPSTFPRAAGRRLHCAVSNVQSAALRSVTSGMSRANSQRLALARRPTASIRWGVDAVRFATIRTRVTCAASIGCSCSWARDGGMTLSSPDTQRKRRGCRDRGVVRAGAGVVRPGGLVRLGVVAVDGTKVAAAATHHATRSYEEIAREILEQAAEIDAAEDELHGDVRGDELPVELRVAGDRRKRLPRGQAGIGRRA